ncbi:serine hydrolase domain-containing protein [Maricaulis maris]|jgi:CubicO group peptidase (beta-lactamase class C family)|uniref:serine hydrolase domain-containing protein n=1 Tax=Maricaulis maris TaxID=74318 RepID=UPI0026EAF44D|nr:serine hydrolase domain-containing protein [Maricaulis maris]
MWRFLVLLLLWLLTAPALPQADPQSAAVEAFLDEAMPAASAPGLAWAILADGDLLVGSRGERVAGSGLAVTDDTPFALGSISKSFTALAIMQQVEAGQLDLDRGVAAYLDGFAGQPGAAITIRQLLSHTSGWSTLQGNSFQTGQAGQDNTLAGHVRQLALTPPARDPGTAWQYSNANYLILGAVIETVSGREFDAYIETEILAPLGMDHSSVGGGAAGESMAVGHQPWFGGRRPVPDQGGASGGMAAAGGIVASAADMALYLAMMSNGEDDLITADHKAMMMRPASAASPHYGFGWFIDAEADAVYHTGLTPGVETLAILSRSEQRGGVVLVNANSGMGFGVTGDILVGMSAFALGGTPQGSGPHFGTQSLYVMVLVLPVLFVAGIILAWRGRSGLRAKSGIAGWFSLGFPVLSTLAMAWVFVDLMPKLFGAPLATFYLYQPDMTILLVASSVTGVGFALFRLVLALGGRR